MIMVSRTKGYIRNKKVILRKKHILNLSRNDRRVILAKLKKSKDTETNQEDAGEKEQEEEKDRQKTDKRACLMYDRLLY